MAYANTTLDDFITEVGFLLDDQTGVFWTAPEITYALQEAMYVFGAETNYWRASGNANITTAASAVPYYDLSVLFPAIRTRAWTLNQMVQEIQYMLLENPSGIAGTGMSGQTTITDILNAIQDALNRFLLDAHLPISVHSSFASPNSGGLTVFPQSSVFVHRVSWQVTSTTTWTNLWRSDEWDVDRSNPEWTTQPGTPQVYSEAALAPLQLQLIPAQNAAGSLEALTVDSVILNLSSGASTFGIPDEWIHAVKYAALSQLLSSESQINDPLRAQYAESRYRQAIAFAKDARSIIRIICNSLPLNIDSLFNIDAGYPYWRNQINPPEMAGILYDIFCPVPAIPDRTYASTVYMSQSAPIPINGGDYIQMGEEDIDNLKKYVTHYLTFKCGGKDFTSTMPDYDAYMKNVSGRKGVNIAKIKYLSPLFAQPQVEWEQRPDRSESQQNQ
jgi:hypothetical protein